MLIFFFQAEDGIRDHCVTGVQTCALPILARKGTELLGPDFGAEIVETHHKMKKDAPSGTAKTLAEILEAGRKSESKIPIQSIREGDIVGEHSVIFSGPAERLELTHRAVSR